MATGYERREGVQDPNANQPASPAASVPVPGIGGPRGADFSKVGGSQRALADVLGKGTALFDKYIAKKAEEWKLEGQMMYAEGKTENEIAATGNRYTMAGFMTMQARTAGNEWTQQALADIDSGDKRLTSEQYQKKLKEQYRTLTESVAGDDPYTRQLFAAMAEDTFSKLVSQQIVSNNAWREDETKRAAVTMGVSELERGTPREQVIEMMSPEMTGLSPERTTEAITEVLKLGFDADIDNTRNMIPTTTYDMYRSYESSVGLPAGLLDEVVSAESGGDRNAVSPKGAKSEMQVMDKTNLDPGFGVVPAQDDSLEERARVGRDYLGALYHKYNKDLEATLIAYNAGHVNADKWLAAGRDYAALPKRSETEPYVNKIMGNLSNPEAGMQLASSATSDLLRAGFTPAQVTTIGSAQEAYMSRKATKFNQERIIAERAIEKEVELEGNLPGALDQIEQMMTERGYDDAWANRMANRVLSAADAYEKEHNVSIKLKGANATGRVAALPPAEQQKAIELKRKEILAIMDTQESLTQEERGNILRESMSDYVAENNVVDDVWKANMSLDLSRPMNKDGTIRPEAVHAFNDYMMLAQKANPGYAAKFLDAEGQKMVAIAESFSVGGYTNTEQALMYAAEIRTKQEAGTFVAPKPIPDKDVDAAVDKIMGGVDSRWFGWRNDKTTAFEVYDNELEQARNNPTIRSAIKTFAYNHMLLDSSLSPEHAAILARNDVQGRMEYVMGNVVLSGRASTIREDMGIADWTSPTTVDKVMLGYLRENGEYIWGEEFNEFAITGVGSSVDEADIRGLLPDKSVISQSISDEIRGVPMMSVRYDTDRKGWIVDRWLNKERTSLANTPHFIPATELGDWAKNSDYGVLNSKSKARWKG